MLLVGAILRHRRPPPPVSLFRAFSSGHSTTLLHIDEPGEWKRKEMYRVLSPEGELLSGSLEIDKEEALNMYITMVRLSIMDKVFFDAQRQGRISFYM